MSHSHPLPTTDRVQTDASLQDERSKSDAAIAAGRAAVKHVADEVLRRAREEADAVLQVAREQADEHLADSHAPAGATAVVERERAVEDAALERDRDSADDVLQLERAETARVLNRLLPAERDQTDRFLFQERTRSDTAVSNRDDFLGLVTHDLRDLLSSIVMSTAVIAAHPGHSPSREQVVAETDRIQRNAARMTRLISDLVDIASIDAGRLSLIPVRDDLGALITEAVHAFRDSAAAKAIRIDASIAAGEAAMFDHSRIFQVVANLLLNAIKFTPRGGTISVTCAAHGNWWQCSVADTGPGIPSARLASVFERFSQGDRPDRRGLGLGLFISKCIVEGHGGRIWADSTIGEGTRVSFTLPRLSPAANRAS